MKIAIVAEACKKVIYFPTDAYVAQKTFVTAHSQHGWLHRTAVNKAKDYLRA